MTINYLNCVFRISLCIIIVNCHFKKTKKSRNYVTDKDYLYLIASIKNHQSKSMKLKIITITSILLVYLNAAAQITEFVKQDSIIYSIHKSNIGKIAFMPQTIAIENFKQTDFLQIFELKDKTDLNIRVFLGNSLTNYLHVLSPNSTAEELTINGNYQFTFIVDNKKVYVENLNVGAGSAESKNQSGIIGHSRPGVQRRSGQSARCGRDRSSPAPLARATPLRRRAGAALNV